MTVVERSRDCSGRFWTAVSRPACVGFQWTIYLHQHESDLTVELESIQPGGVANGWCELEHEPDRVRALLVAFMRLSDAEPALAGTGGRP